MTKLLVTGCNGQLGLSLQEAIAAYPDLQATFTDSDTLDLTDRDAVEKTVAEGSYDYIVNCAAYTAVDMAESDEIAAWKINAEAVRHLARAAKASKTKVIHISTDYVFPGKSFRPYDEHDEPLPRSIYGRTKLEGEAVLTSFCPDAVIIRTAWLYSEHGRNFVKAILNKAASDGQLRVVNDQIGTPTYAADLAEVILKMVSMPEWKPGIYHFSDEGVASWYDFAVAIMRLTGQSDVKVTPVSTAEYPTAAQRPMYAVLNKAKIRKTLGIEIPHWEKSLTRCLKKMGR